jgi:ComF family protein
MQKKLLSSGFMKGIDAIIPIPLHYRKLLKRGYNQSEELADGIALMTGVPVYNKVVKRVAHQRSQTSIGRGDRFDRMASSYKLGKQSLNGNHVLLVDDVVTTGATIEAVAKLLIEKYDVKVSVVSLAVRID